MSLKNIIFLAGLLHFCQVPAMLMAPRMLHWQEDLSKLMPINRRIFQVIAGAIMLTVLGLGLVVMAASEEIASGSTAGTGLCLFLGIFWAYRAAIQIFIYAAIWPGDFLGRASHYALSALFIFLAGAYSVFFVHSIQQAG